MLGIVPAVSDWPLSERDGGQPWKTGFGKGSTSLRVSEVVVDLATVPIPSTCWGRDVFEAMGMHAFLWM